jgi:hypothetical protein
MASAATLLAIAIAADRHQISVAATKHDAQAATTASKTLVRDAATVKAGDTALSSSLKLLS